jgi:hypothetical protein
MRTRAGFPVLNLALCLPASAEMNVDRACNEVSRRASALGPVCIDTLSVVLAYSITVDGVYSLTSLSQLLEIAVYQG